MVNYTANQPKF